MIWQLRTILHDVLVGRTQPTPQLLAAPLGDVTSSVAPIAHPPAFVSHVAELAAAVAFLGSAFRDYVTGSTAELADVVG
jgi:hypothetical protein